MLIFFFLSRLQINIHKKYLMIILMNLCFKVYIGTPEIYCKATKAHIYGALVEFLEKRPQVFCLRCCTV